MTRSLLVLESRLTLNILCNKITVWRCHKNSCYCQYCRWWVTGIKDAFWSHRLCSSKVQTCLSVESSTELEQHAVPDIHCIQNQNFRSYHKRLHSWHWLVRQQGITDIMSEITIMHLLPPLKNWKWRGGVKMNCLWWDLRCTKHA